MPAALILVTTAEHASKKLHGGGYESACSPGHYGPECQLETDLCADPNGANNCYGNGICEIIHDDFTNTLRAHCTCFGEYEPTVRCSQQLRYDVCESEDSSNNMVCSGGTCHYTVGSRYSRECPASK